MIILNDNEKPITANNLAVGTAMDVYRYDKDGQLVGAVGTVRVTEKTVNEDGTAVINYTFTPGALQGEAGVQTTDGQFGTDEWGIVDFDNLHVTDLFTESTLDNAHSDTYYYKLVTSLGAESESTGFMTVPVLKTKHAVNGATYSQSQVDGDTNHSLKSPSHVDVMVEMKNMPNVFRYGAVDVAQGVDTIGRALRVEENRFAVQNKAQDGTFYDGDDVTFEGDESQNVILCDNTFRGVGNYVPVIHAYTQNEYFNQVESTYGADLISDDLPSVSFAITYKEKSAPFYNNTLMGYAAELEINPSVPATDQTPYLYRVWRVMPDESEVLLNDLKDTIVYNPDGSVLWQTDYSNLHKAENSTFKVLDRFVYNAISQGQSLTIDYIVRLYSVMNVDLSSQMRSNRDGSYGMAESEGSTSFDDGTTTAIYELTYEQPKSVTYYNTLGIASSTPFDGVNIIVIQYMNGETVIQKHVY